MGSSRGLARRGSRAADIKYMQMRLHVGRVMRWCGRETGLGGWWCSTTWEWKPSRSMADLAPDLPSSGCLLLVSCFSWRCLSFLSLPLSRAALTACMQAPCMALSRGRSIRSLARPFRVLRADVEEEVPRRCRFTTCHRRCAARVHRLLRLLVLLRVQQSAQLARHNTTAYQAGIPPRRPPCLFGETALHASLTVAWQLCLPRTVCEVLTPTRQSIEDRDERGRLFCPNPGSGYPAGAHDGC